MHIRETAESDLAAVLDVETLAFGPQEGPGIAALVEDLLADPTAAPRLSLLAVDDGRPLGHILFTKACVADAESPVSAAILAPLAIVPEKQRQGMGGQLIGEGLRRLACSGVDLVFVLGHPEYYPRHGFAPAGVHGLEAPYPIPEEHADAWMVQELRPGILGGVRGTIRCADALHQPEYWRE